MRCAAKGAPAAESPHDATPLGRFDQQHGHERQLARAAGRLTVRTPTPSNEVPAVKLAVVEKHIQFISLR